MAKRPLPTPELLRQLLSYDPKTGHLTWKPRLGFNRWNARYAGTIAGATDRYGYLSIKIHDKSYLAHRIIWAMRYGCWVECVDHINGEPGDNRLRNLRAVTRKINQRNQKRHSCNTSGRTGVSWNRHRNVWVAQIGVDGRSVYLGSFDQFDDAVKARIKAEKRHCFTGRQ